LKHVHRVTARGRAYFYHRVTRERLPADPIARAAALVAIDARLASARPRAQPAVPIVDGTMADLITLYKGDAAFTARAKKTRADYAGYLDAIRAEFGDLMVSEWDREAVLELRSRHQATPRKADYLVAVLRRLFAFAIDRPRRFGLATNPAARPGRLYTPRETANRPWTQAEYDRFMAGTFAGMRTALALARFAALRERDVVRLPALARQHGQITAKHHKTGADVWIPEHPDLTRVLDAAATTTASAAASASDAASMTLVTGKRGRPFASPDGFRTMFFREAARLGLAVTFHGLRHMAGEALAEAGCTENEIMAVMGHKTPAMAAHYTRRASQKRLAIAAIAKLRRTEPGGPL
jgi:integrase